MATEYKWYRVYDFAAHGAEPQDMFTLRPIEVNGKDLVLGRNADGYFAIDAKCPHAGYPMAQGKCLEDGSVMCIYHRYCFDPKTGREFSGHGEYINTYPVKVDETGVSVGLKKKWWELW